VNELADPEFGSANLEVEIVPVVIEAASIDAEVRGTQLNSFDPEVLITLERFTEIGVALWLLILSVSVNLTAFSILIYTLLSTKLTSSALSPT